MPTSLTTPQIAIRDFLYIAPAITLAAWGLLLLLIDCLLLRRAQPAHRQATLGGLAILGAVAALMLVALDLPTWSGLGYDDTDPILFFGTLAGDASTRALNLLIAALLSLVCGISLAWPFTRRWGEYFALLFWAATAMMLLIAADELLTLFISLETMTLCLYLVTAFDTDNPRSAEAGLKYFVYGSVSSALFLFGLSLVYGMTGTTRIDAIARVLNPQGIAHPGLLHDPAAAVAVLLIFVGFGFKIAAVPFHQWAPDVYEGAPAPVAAWIATGSKLASFVAMMKVLNHALESWAVAGRDFAAPGWLGLLAIVAALTMTFGNLAALSQRSLKRLLAYSSIAHAGYMLVGVLAVAVRPNNEQAAGAVLFYLVIYSLTTMAAFALVAWIARDQGSDDIDALNGLGNQSPVLAVALVLLFLSLIGIPPLAGFFGKLYIIMEALNSGEVGSVHLTWLAAFILVNSVISAFYYIRILRAIYLRPPGVRPIRPATSAISVPIMLGAALTLFIGLFPSTLLDPMKGAALPMLATSAQVPIEVPRVTSEQPATVQPPAEVPVLARREQPVPVPSQPLPEHDDGT